MIRFPLGIGTALQNKEILDLFDDWAIDIGKARIVLRFSPKFWSNLHVREERLNQFEVYSTLTEQLSH